MPEILYAVHTKTCTYLLDDEGVCRWIVSTTGMVPPEVRRCLGAQFVASLDLRLPGGLAGELRIGAFALFVAPREDDPSKIVLLRTSVIMAVEFRDPHEPLPEPASTLGADELPTKPLVAPPAPPAPMPKVAAPPGRPAPPPSPGSPVPPVRIPAAPFPSAPRPFASPIGKPTEVDIEITSDSLDDITIDPDYREDPTGDLDPEDIVMYTGEEATVTLTLPLFRPDAKMRIDLPPPRPPRPPRAR